MRLSGVDSTEVTDLEGHWAFFYCPLYFSEGSCWAFTHVWGVSPDWLTRTSKCRGQVSLIKRVKHQRVDKARLIWSCVSLASGMCSRRTPAGSSCSCSVGLLLLQSGFILERGACNECRRCSEPRCRQKGSSLVRFCVSNVPLS